MGCVDGREAGVSVDFMQNIFFYPLEQLPFVFLALMIAFTFHEWAHAFFAWKFGDPTAKEQGRVSLNPIVHLDVLGTLFIFIAGFGWAKPVPVDRRRFKHPRLMGIMVSAVGPLSNVLLGVIGVIVLYLLFDWGVFELASLGVSRALSLFFGIFIHLNVLLFFFNLLPLPPLDGYRIVEDVAPSSIRYQMSKLEPWGIFIFLLLIFIPPLHRLTIGNVYALTQHMIRQIHYFIGSFF